MSSDTVRLAAAIRVTRAAAARLRDSIENDAEALRSGVAAGDSADREQSKALDAFVQRYQQMFEHMAQRLFSAIYRADELGERPPPLRTLFIWAEETGLVNSAMVWGERAELRNRLVHEYPVQAAQRAVALTSAIREAALMLDEFEAALAYIDRKDLLEGGQP